MFEGQIAPHLYFHSPDLLADGAVFDHPVVDWAVSFTPLLRLRMLSTRSTPVRTPSYMPRPLMDWQLLRASAVDTSDDARMFGESPIRVWGLYLSPWAHHSNGQDGCTFDYQTLEEGECLGERAAGQPLHTNKTDGSFSTNFIRVGVGYEVLGDFRGETASLVPGRRCSFQLGLDFHPIGYMIGPLEGELADVYPQWQPYAELAREWRIPGGQLELALRGQGLFGNRGPGVDPVAYQAELSYTPRWLGGGWGPFLRFYDGMDYYNLGFLEDIQYLQFGFTWDGTVAPEIQLPTLVDLGEAPPPYPRSRLLDDVLPAPLDWLCGLG